MLFAGILLVGTATESFAQATASATATATVITPITIAKDVDMNFGNLAVHATTAGTVQMDPASSRTATGGVTLPATTGTVSAAQFTVSGEAGYTYAITLPNSLTIASGTDNMTVDNFTSSPASTGLLTGGTEILTVGATLNVAAAQPSGTYVSATPFDVTVNYN